MGHSKLVGNGIRKRPNNFEDSNTSCNCAWQSESSYAIAVGLSILEAKRLCLLFFGIFVDWHLLQFSGGFIPVVLTLVAVSIGLPASAATVLTIHKRRKAPCFPTLSTLLRYLSAIIFVCALTNAAVILSIGLFVNISSQAIERAFNDSMMRYSSESSSKVTIDELQFKFQCCGHKNYFDWVEFDWQKTDYASRDEMSKQQRLSDEDFRSLAVPYSCCSITAMMPCFHMDLTMNMDSINKFGCSHMLSRNLTRGAVISYCLTIFLVLTQLVVAFLLTQIVRRCTTTTRASLCGCSEKSSSIHPLLESSTSCVSSIGYTSESDRNSSCCRTSRRHRRLSTIASRNTDCESSTTPSPPSTTTSKKSSVRNTIQSARPRCSARCEAARIRPSTHTEHRVPKRRSGMKRARVN